MENLDNKIYGYFKKELSKERYAPLLRKERIKLIRRFEEEGDKEARDKVVNSIQRYIFSQAIFFRDGKVPIMDLIQEINSKILSPCEKWGSKKRTLGIIGRAIKKELKKGVTYSPPGVYPQVYSLSDVINKGEGEKKLRLELVLGEDGTEKRIFREGLRIPVRKEIDRIIDMRKKDERERCERVLLDILLLNKIPFRRQRQKGRLSIIRDKVGMSKKNVRKIYNIYQEELETLKDKYFSKRGILEEEKIPIIKEEIKKYVMIKYGKTNIERDKQIMRDILEEMSGTGKRFFIAEIGKKHGLERKAIEQIYQRIKKELRKSPVLRELYELSLSSWD